MIKSLSWGHNYPPINEEEGFQSIKINFWSLHMGTRRYSSDWPKGQAHHMEKKKCLEKKNKMQLTEETKKLIHAGFI